MRPLKLLGAVALAVMLLGSHAHGGCSDDARLYAIGDFLEALKAGPVQPLRLTPETYLNLTPKARQAIGNNLVILDQACQPVQVFEGEPPVRLMQPFHILYSAYYDAVLRGDAQTMGILLRGFKAAPVDPVEFMSMLGVITQDDVLTEQMAQAAGIKPHNTNAGERCTESKSYLMFADLFTRFGGLVEGRNGRAWIVGGGRHQMLNLDDDVLREAEVLVNGCSQHRQASLSVAQLAGAICYDTGYGRSATDQLDWHSTRSHWFERYDRWIKIGSPDEVPKSLFD